MKPLSIHKTGLLFVLPLAFSCCSRNISDRLNDIGSYIQERPDSALTALEMIDKGRLRNKRDIAYYSLLYATALDKNYIDTTDLSIIEPAVEYFSKNGSPDEKLKAYYYQGVINHNANKLNNAAISFHTAELYAAESSDMKYKGLLYSMFACVYRDTYNTSGYIKYIQKAEDLYIECGDRQNADKCLYDMACAKMGHSAYSQADTLFSLAAGKMRGDTLMMGLILSEHAKTKIFKIPAEPAETINLLECKKSSYRQEWSAEDWYLYAYAVASTGDLSRSDRITHVLDSNENIDDLSKYYWKYRISKAKGDYKNALNSFETVVRKQEQALEDALSSTVMETIKDFETIEAQKHKTRSRINMLLSIIITLVFMLVGVIALLWFRKYRENKETEVNRLLNLASETQNEIKQQKENSQKELLRLRSAYLNEIKGHMNSAQEFNILLQGNVHDSDNQFLLNKLKSAFPDYLNDPEAQKSIEKKINSYMNNIISNLRKDYPEINDTEVLFYCFHVLGFSSSAIASVMKISMSNYYVRKSRLKEKIAREHYPNTDKYISHL